MILEPSPTRVPCALVLDASHAMPDDAMTALNQALRDLRATLYEDPDTRDVVEITVATYGRRAEMVREFARPGDWHLPTLHADGEATIGDALDCAMNEIARRVGQYRDVGQRHRRPWLLALVAATPDDRASRAAHRLQIEVRDGCFRFEGIALAPDAADGLRAIAPEPESVRVVAPGEIAAVFAAIGRGLRRAAAAA